MSKRIPPRLADDNGGKAASARWQLGEFELDETRRELRLNGQPVVIEPKPLNLLMLLVRHPGELITKDELIERLWGGRAVSDTVIARCVAKLRSALSERQDWVRTIHGYGYRYDGWVEPLTLPTAAALPTRLVVGISLPGREGWRLLRRLGHSGETWLAQHESGGQRVYKLALDAGRLTALKREAAVHRLLTASPASEQGAVTELVPLLDWNFHAVPYFLEFAFCERGNLSEWLARLPAPLPRSLRLGLVIQLAEKLSAIHALGVLHKDFKPDNVLVLAELAGQLPKLALSDFGSGGVVDIDRLRNLGFTRMGLTVSALDADSTSGTPLYLAPEVVAGHPWTRQSDIYALGVLLYQLLVDDLRRPLAPGWEREIDDPLLREDIAAACDQSPKYRLSDARQLAGRLGTLDARRAASAESAAALAEAAALRDSLARARARRGWQWAITAALAVGIGASSTLYHKARRAQQEAESASATANAVSEFLDSSVLGAADPYKAGGGRNVTIASVLDKAVQDFDRLGSQPQLQARLGGTLANAYHNLGLEMQALEVARAALAAARKGGIADESAAVNALRDRAAWINIDLARFDEAGALFQQNLDHSDSDAARYGARYGLARVRFEQGYFVESARDYRALLTPEMLSGADAWAVSDVRWDLSESEFELHHWEGAKSLLAEVRQHYERQLKPDNAQLLWLAVSEAYRLQMLEHWPEAEAILQDLRQQAVAQLGEAHPIPMTALQLLGIVRIKQGRAAEALPMIDTVLAWRRLHYGEAHYLTRMSMARRAEALIQLGRTGEAEPLLRDGLQASIAALGREHPHTLDTERLLAECLAAAGRPAEAEALFREVLALGPRRMPAGNNRLAWARYGLGRLLLARGDQLESRALLRQAAADFRQNFDGQHSMQAVIEALLRNQPAPAGQKPGLS